MGNRGDRKRLERCAIGDSTWRTCVFSEHHGSNMLINNNELGFEDFLQFASMFVLERPDPGIHHIECKAAESLWPVINQLVQWARRVAAWCAIAIQLETVLIIVVHAFRPPIESDFFPTAWTKDRLKVCTAIEEPDRFRNNDLNFIRIRSNLTEPVSSDRLPAWGGNEMRIDRNQGNPIVRHSNPSSS